MVIVGILVVGMFLNLRNHWLERRAIENYLSEHKLDLESEVNKKYAVKVADLVRKSFNTNAADWKFYDRSKEPFLRHSVLTLLEHKEGKCGKGTRVLVRLLQTLGFDATRVSLYSKNLSAKESHTLVSIKINGKEYLIDSINSPQELNDFLRNNDVSCADFGISSYSQRFSSQTILHSNLITEQFSIFSYEAIPASKLASKLGMGFRVFNHERPSTTVSYFAESVYLIQFLVLALTCLVTLCLFIGFSQLVKRLKR